MEQRARNRHLLAHSLAEGGHPAVRMLRHLDHGQVAIHRAGQVRAAKAIETAVVRQVLARGQLLVQSGALGQDAGDRPDAL